MNAKEIAKLLSEKGLTPEQVAKIIERYERQKERTKQYQKQTYAKVSISVRKDTIKEVSSLAEVPEDYVKKYLAGQKILQSIPPDVLKKIREVTTLLKEVKE